MSSKYVDCYVGGRVYHAEVVRWNKRTVIVRVPGAFKSKAIKRRFRYLVEKHARNDTRLIPAVRK